MLVCHLCSELRYSVNSSFHLACNVLVLSHPFLPFCIILPHYYLPKTLFTKLPCHSNSGICAYQHRPSRISSHTSQNIVQFYRMLYKYEVPGRCALTNLNITYLLTYLPTGYRQSTPLAGHYETSSLSKHHQSVTVKYFLGQPTRARDITGIA